MVEIVKKCEKREVECGRCKCLLSFTFEDLKPRHMWFIGVTYDVFNCPHCNHEIGISRYG